MPEKNLVVDCEPNVNEKPIQTVIQSNTPNMLGRSLKPKTDIKLTRNDASGGLDKIEGYLDLLKEFDFLQNVNDNRLLRLLRMLQAADTEPKESNQATELSSPTGSPSPKPLCWCHQSARRVSSRRHSEDLTFYSHSKVALVRTFSG